MEAPGIVNRVVTTVFFCNPCVRYGPYLLRANMFIWKKINLSEVLSGQNVGIKEVEDKVWLVSFMDYDLGYFDEQTCKLEPLDNPFGARVLPMSSV